MTPAKFAGRSLSRTLISPELLLLKQRVIDSPSKVTPRLPLPQGDDAAFHSVGYPRIIKLRVNVESVDSGPVSRHGRVDLNPAFGLRFHMGHVSIPAIFVHHPEKEVEAASRALPDAATDL